MLVNLPVALNFVSFIQHFSSHPFLMHLDGKRHCESKSALLQEHNTMNSEASSAHRDQESISLQYATVSQNTLYIICINVIPVLVY